MRRWEFDTIAQATSCISSWFQGTLSEKLMLKEYLNSTIGKQFAFLCRSRCCDGWFFSFFVCFKLQICYFAFDNRVLSSGGIFYDAKQDILEILSDSDEDGDGNGDSDSDSCGDDEDESNDDENCNSKNSSTGNDSLGSFFKKLNILSRTGKNEKGFQTPPPSVGLYKRRKITGSPSPRVEVDSRSDDPSEICAESCGNAVEASQYTDVLILLRFNDRDLPFTLRKIIMSDVRLLTLLEAGLPSWVIFLQSYPGFCHLYRPWMCPLARALYVLISVVTVLIGFYDLYKNVPVLKATASRLFGPLFDWIETWEMITRIKCLGTMLFLHNFQKAVQWFLTIRSTTRSFFSVLAQPLAEPLLEVLEIVLPVWNVSVKIIEGFFSVIGLLVDSSCSIVGDIVEFFFFPIWFAVSLVWNIGRSPAIFSSLVFCTILLVMLKYFLDLNVVNETIPGYFGFAATTVLYPIIRIVWEVLYAPIRLIFGFANLISLACTSVYEMFGEIWEFISSIVRLASASEATITAHEVSIWRSLWNDLFSQVSFFAFLIYLSQ